jgi:hypothetical protein
MNLMQPFNKMDEAEKLVHQFLVNKGFIPDYEPHGNVFPDFRVNGDIAVEVTRLHSHCFENQSKPYALVERYVPFDDWLSKVLKSYRSPVDTESWLVDFAPIHPINGWAREVKAAVESELLTFYKSKSIDRKDKTVRVLNSIEITFTKSGALSQSFFVLGGSESAEGCLVVNEMEKNIQHLVDRKEEKLLACSTRYSQYWLALVDYIDYGMAQEDFEELQSRNINRGMWTKILLLNPDGTNQAWEL